MLSRNTYKPTTTRPAPLGRANQTKGDKMKKSDKRFVRVEEITGYPVWSGTTSGGYGNGPYSTRIKVGGECPADEVVGNFGGCDVIRHWGAMTLIEVENWLHLADILPKTENFEESRKNLQLGLKRAWPERQWFWED
jgi:hypothetical protein